jgi:hypothetical protein
MQQLEERIKLACDIANGVVSPNENDSGYKITGGKKDLNCKGRGDHWYRMVFRDGCWNYVSSDRLPMGTLRASDRRCTVYGEVYNGEIVVSHDYGSAVDCAWLVVPPDDDNGKSLVEISFLKRRDGKLVFKLPDESQIVLENPRQK